MNKVNYCTVAVIADEIRSYPRVQVFYNARHCQCSVDARGDTIIIQE